MNQPDKIFNPTVTKEQRQLLRQNMPLAEQLLWSRLKHCQLGGYKFRRQQGIGKFIVDFYCPSIKLVIEIDGESHFANDDSQQYDTERDLFLKSLGLRVFRFSNTEVYANLDGVVNTILQHLS
ncbi:MAG: DUF559 domain-containing protein [Patescibacteria group bacterium]|jgi:very-short-patch-repair endonuclease